MSEVVDVQFETRYGTITGLQWGSGQANKMVAFHGWLDNAASFWHIAPLMAAAGYEITAIDFPGHGHSDHRAPGHNYGFIDYVIDMQAVMDGYDEPVVMLCHSMGAAIASLYASAYPEQVSQLVLIENTGPVPPYVPGTGAKSLREALDVWRPHSLEHKRQYACIEDAIKARIQATPMDQEIIRPLVERGLKASEKGWHWRTDKRLKLRSFFRMSEEQTQDFLSSLPMPRLLVVGEPRTYALDYSSYQDRVSALNPTQYVEMPGCHHLHMTQAKAVADVVIQFLKDHPGQVSQSNDTKVHPRPFHPF